MLSKLKTKYKIAIAACLSILVIGGGIWAYASTPSYWTDGNDDAKKEDKNYDISWYDPTDTYSTFCVRDGRELAGVAKLVNDGVIITKDTNLRDTFGWGDIEFKDLKKIEQIDDDGHYKIQDSFAGKTVEFCETVGGVDQPIGEVDLAANVWVPIGTEDHPFEGVLSGKSGTIVNIQNMNITSIKDENVREYIGLVGHLAQGGLVAGINFTGGGIDLTNIDADVFAGAAVGKIDNHSELINITNATPINIQTSGAAYVGGLAGRADNNSLISNSVNNANVMVDSTGDAVNFANKSKLINLEEEQETEQNLEESLEGEQGSEIINKEEETGSDTEKNTELADESNEKDTQEGEINPVPVSNASIETTESTEEQDSIVDQTVDSDSEDQLDDAVNSDNSLDGDTTESELEEDSTETIDLEDSLEKKKLSLEKTKLATYETPHVYVGGIVGYTDGAKVVIKKVTNEGNVEAQGNIDVYASGIVGYTTGLLEMHEQDTQIENKGSILVERADRAFTGGIVGKAHGKVTLSLNTLNSADVTVDATMANLSAAGGLIGGMGTVYPQIDIPYTNTVEVTSNGGSNVHTGGIIGLSEAPVEFVELNKNSGKITVNGNTGIFTGGIIGSIITSMDGTITNIENIGEIEVNGNASIYTGGYIGKVEAPNSVTDVKDLTYDDVNNDENNNLIHVVAIDPSTANFIATGGIVGYYNSVNSKVENTSFKGRIEETGGTHETTFTGGIIGYLENGKVAEANVGKAKDSYANILADGSIGGVVGFMNTPATSIVDDATVKHVGLTARSDKGVIGGIVGKAKGHIINAFVGQEDYDSVTINTKNGKTELTAGGIAGVLLQEATVGSQDAPENVNVKNINLVIDAQNSQIGGAIGLNQSPKVNLLVDTLKMDVKTTPVNVGGVVGSNDVADDSLIAEEDHTLIAKNVEITNKSKIADVHIGGVYGENLRSTTKSLGEDLNITSDGQANKIGGNVGVNKGTVSNSTSENVVIISSGANSEIGGIAGRSEGTSEKKAKVEDSHVLAEESALITTTGTQSKIGGIVGYGDKTEILNSTLKAVTPNTARILVRATEVHAGGIAGELTESKIEGNKTLKNVDNLLISTNVPTPEQLATATQNTRIGGFVGYNNESRIDKVVGNNVDLRINGKQSYVGGMAGYNKGTEDAIIKDSYVLGLKLDTSASADSSVVGGIVGYNAERTIDEDSVEPQDAISSIQGSRSVGPITVNAPKATTGGLVGTNETVIANNSIADKNNVTSTGADSKIGGLVGLNTDIGTIYYTYSNNNIIIEGKGTFAGGLVGVNEGKVLSSYIDIDVTARNYGTSSKDDLLYLGGLVGKNTGTIDKSYTNSKVIANAPNTNVGGLVGLHAEGEIKNSYVGQQVTANGVNSYAGGFIGKITKGTVEGSYSAAQVKSAANFQGGFIGYYDNSSKNLLSRNYYLKDEKFNKDLPDFAEGNYRWLNAPTKLSTIHRDSLMDRTDFPNLSQWDFENTWRYGSPNAVYKFPELNRLANTGNEEIDDDIANIVNANINWYTVDKQKPVYEIKTEAELAGLAAIVNGMIPGLERFDFEGRTINIASTIHIQSNQWVPIGHKEETPFNGTFNGNGDQYLIHGLKVTKQHDYIGLFGLIGESGTVTNVQLEADIVAGDNETGVLAGVNKGKVSDIHVTLLDGAIVQGKTVGGIIGKNTGAITDLNLTLDEGSRVEAISNESIVGGMIGENESNVEPSTYTMNRIDGSIGSKHEDVTIGGIIGRQTGAVTSLSVDMIDNYKITSEGANNIVGGVIGHYVSGKASDITVTFKDGIIEASGANSTIGAVIGKSDKGNMIENVAVTTDDTEATVPHISGTGIVGSIIGDKTGNGDNTFDMTNVKTEKIVLGTVNGSADSVLIGGIAGKLTDTALKDATFAAAIDANIAGMVTAGGIVGEANDSIIYDVKVLPETTITSNAKSTNNHIIGGVAGTINATDRDAALDFGFAAPLYKGIYSANVEANEIKVSGEDTKADLYVGAIVGQNNNASIYFSDSSTPLTVNNGNNVYVGGMIGHNQDGIAIQSKSVSPIDANTSKYYYVGGFVGKTVDGEIHHSQVTDENEAMIKVGTAKGKDETTFVGGFAGLASNTNMSYAYADIPVEITCTNVENVINAGGFAGYLDNLDVSEASLLQKAISFFTADSPSKPLLERVYAKGDVKVSGKVMSYAGGFVGYMDHYEIKDAYATGNVDNSGFDTRSAGFAAYVEKEAEITNALANTADHIKATGVNNATRAYAGGFAALNDGKLTDIESKVKENNISISNIRNENDANVRKDAVIAYNFTHGSFTEAKDGVSLPYGEWSTDPDATILLAEGDGTTLAVKDAKELTAVVMLYNDNVSELKYYSLFNRAADKLTINHITLLDNITLAEGKVWLPIAKFESSATFNGSEKTVNGVNIRKVTKSGYKIHHGIYPNITDDKEYTGFVAQNAGTIQALSLPNVYMEGDSNTGAVAGKNSGTIQDIMLSGSTSITGEDQLGGVAGRNTGTIQDIMLSGSTSISGKAQLGGMAGENTNLIQRVTLNGALTIDGDHELGGISGVNTGAITNAASKEIVVKGKNEVGGIAGNNAGTISIVDLEKVTISGKNELGGITGINTGVIGSEEGEINLQTLKIDGDTNIGGIAGINGALPSEITPVSLDDEASNHMITNTAITALNLTGTSHVGGVTGVNDGTITGSEVTGTITNSGDFTGGIAGMNNGTITNVKATGKLAIVGKDHVGGVAGINGSEQLITDVTFKDVSLEGTNEVGSIAGANDGMISKVDVQSSSVKGKNELGGITGVNTGIIGSDEEVVILQSLTINGENNVGGATGTNSGSISNVDVQIATIHGENSLGGVTGTNTGNITSVNVEELSIDGEDQIGGAAGTNSETITEIELKSVKLNGNHAGGIVGINDTDGTISKAQIETLDVKASENTGGIAAINKGMIEQNPAAGKITTDSKVLGGIAGVNEGTIRTSYIGGSLNSSNKDSIIAGGIAAENNGAIEQSFSYADINVSSKVAKIGGIAGTNTGNIKDVYNSGRIVVKGIGDSDVRTWAGGIVGYTEAGTISNALNYSEVISSIDEKIVPQQSFYGGIAGQISETAITNTAFNRQMLKANTAYYDSDKKRVSGSTTESKGMLSSELTSGTLPSDDLHGNWQAVSGFYPQLTGFTQNVTKLSTVAVILHEHDVVNRITREFALTNDPDVNWTSDPSSAISGILNGSKAILTAVVGEDSRTIVINEEALLFIDKASKPTVVTDPDTETFQEKVVVELTTTETGGEIYYTLDGSSPYPNEGTTAKYAEPFELSETTTLKAITIAEDKEPSDVLTHKLTKQPSIGGGGGGGAIIPPTAETTINDKPVNGEMNNGVLEANFTLSDVDLTNSKEIVISGQDQTIQGYAFRFDQTIKQQVVKDQRNIRVDLPLAKLVITPKMVEKMTQDLEVKVISNNPSTLNAMNEIATSVGATVLDEGRGVTVDTNAFAAIGYQTVKTSIPVPTGLKASDITAVVLRGPNGQWTTIPWTLNGSNVDVQLTGSGNVSFIRNVNTFNDVRNGFWGEQSINEASSKLFVLGKGNGQFDPENKVTRAEYPTILLRVAGFMQKDASSNFNDVGSNAWFNRSVAIATQMGIVTGVSETSYVPEASLTRVEAMTMVGRLLSVLEMSQDISETEADKILSQFNDGQTIPDWAKKATALSIKNGIIEGENNSINPQNTLTRAQAATIAVRIDKFFTNK
ncbi:S-layer homology domain-containing protein [Cytobacillus sp. FJAT-53684]|uniref:S-layer homology domain-containing protein n=1 Tax=Cytobacillus mangrovibacter TaxID=3299024 RepID=A0ABW6K2P3_9BACI